MLIVAQIFFQFFYNCDLDVKGKTLARDLCLQSITRKVSKAQNNDLFCELDMQGLWEAVKDFPKGKVLGEDGILIKVFQALWPDIGKDIKAWILRVLNFRSIDTSYNSNKIVFIPKKNDKFLLINYRPIYHLGPTYKALMKTLSNHLKQHLDSWIPCKQLLVKE
jgi:hypothetical protein